MSRVYIARCPDYEEIHVSAAVRESVDALGGIRAFIKPGQRVLIKPNLLRPTPPERGITTHPSVVSAVVRLVQKAGATPIIADSPGGPHNKTFVRLTYERTGMAAIARGTGALCSDDMRTTHVPYPPGHLLKQLDMLALAAEADAIINLPRLKTHGLTLFTGAIKNLFGVIPGLTKSAYHARLPDVKLFSQLLVDIHQCCAPVLTVMDAVTGMEGSGPSHGALRDVGLILASGDGIALDVVATSLVGIAPLAVPTLAAAAQWGLTSGRIEDLDILGMPLAEARLSPPFKLPETVIGSYSSLQRLILQFWPSHFLDVYPTANERCVACGTCVDACPVKAISIVEGRARMNAGTCIRCYCCHELCPHNAVDLKRRPLAWLFSR